MADNIRQAETSGLPPLQWDREAALFWLVDERDRSTIQRGGGAEDKDRGVGLVHRHYALANRFRNRKVNRCCQIREDFRTMGEANAAVTLWRQRMIVTPEAELQIGVGLEGLNAERLQRAIGCEAGEHEAGKDRAAARSVGNCAVGTDPEKLASQHSQMRFAETVDDAVNEIIVARRRE